MTVLQIHTGKMEANSFLARDVDLWSLAGEASRTLISNCLAAPARRTHSIQPAHCCHAVAVHSYLVAAQQHLPGIKGQSAFTFSAASPVARSNLACALQTGLCRPCWAALRPFAWQQRWT